MAESRTLVDGGILAREAEVVAFASGGRERIDGEAALAAMGASPMAVPRPVAAPDDFVVASSGRSVATRRSSDRAGA
jgi:hypothetical protein